MPRSKPSIIHENAPPHDWSKTRLSDEAVKEFAIKIHRGEIFTECQVRDKHLLSMIFMPLAFGLGDMARDPELMGGLAKSPPGMCYAEVSNKNTAPRSINGYPIFWSCAFLSKEDTDRVQDKYLKIIEALDEV